MKKSEKVKKTNIKIDIRIQTTEIKFDLINFTFFSKYNLQVA